MLTPLSVLELFLLAISLVMLAGLFISSLDAIRIRVPFVSTKSRRRMDITSAMELSDGDTLVDLGCGNGVLLLNAKRSVEGITAIGVEFGMLPYAIARLRTLGSGVTIRFADARHFDVSRATHLYIYMSPRAMGEFEQKLFSECRPGTKIFALDFTFPHHEVTRTLAFDTPDKLSSTLHCYVVR